MLVTGKIWIFSVILGLSLFFIKQSKATQFMGNEYYPIAGEEKMSADKVQAEHEKRMRKIDKKYNKKINAINRIYEKKIKKEDAHRAKIMVKRESMGELRKKRLAKRRGKQKELMKKKASYAHERLEGNNPFVEKMKEKRKYFRKKREKKMQKRGKLGRGSDSANGDR